MLLKSLTEFLQCILCMKNGFLLLYSTKRRSHDRKSTRIIAISSCRAWVKAIEKTSDRPLFLVYKGYKYMKTCRHFQILSSRRQIAIWKSYTLREMNMFIRLRSILMWPILITSIYFKLAFEISITLSLLCILHMQV